MLLFQKKNYEKIVLFDWINKFPDKL